jgi:hypothetical protein
MAWLGSSDSLPAYYQQEVAASNLSCIDFILSPQQPRTSIC